jgi:hypothetical protein
MVFYKGASAKPLIAERSNIIPTLIDGDKVTGHDTRKPIQIRRARKGVGTEVGAKKKPSLLSLPGWETVTSAYGLTWGQI